MVRLISLGPHPQMIQTLVLESSELAALRWISGRPTASPLPLLPILALFKDSTNVPHPPSAETMPLTRDIREYVIKMDVISTHTEQESLTSMDQACPSIPRAPSP